LLNGDHRGRHASRRAAFGVGWGLAGYCPGPAIVSLGLAPGRVWVFCATMALGVFIGDALGAPGRAPDDGADAAQAPAC
jgi:hypothetical protein